MEMESIGRGVPPASPWHAWRRQGITSTDAVSIMAEDCARAGVDVYGSPLQVWLDKKGLLPAKEETEAMYWGTQLEPLLVQEFGKRTSHLVMGLGPGDTWMTEEERRRSTWVKDEHGRDRFVEAKDGEPWARATPDARYKYRYREAGETPWNDIPLGLLECKTTSARFGERWGVLPPLPAQIQAQWQLYVSGLEHGALVCLIGGQRFVGYEFTRDEQFIAYMADRCRSFWEQHVLADVEPQPIANDLELVRDLAGKDRGLTVELPAAAVELDEQLRKAEDDASVLKIYIDGRKAQLIHWIGGASFGEIPGVCRYSYAADKNGRRSLRRKALP